MKVVMKTLLGWEDGVEWLYWWVMEVHKQVQYYGVIMKRFYILMMCSCQVQWLEMMIPKQVVYHQR